MLMYSSFNSVISFNSCYGSIVVMYVTGSDLRTASLHLVLSRDQFGDDAKDRSSLWKQTYETSPTLHLSVNHPSVSPSVSPSYLCWSDVVGDIHDFVVVNSKTFDLRHHWWLNSRVSHLVGLLIDKHPPDAHTETHTHISQNEALNKKNKNLRFKLFF